MVAHPEKPWVQAMQAKYFPRRAYLETQRKYACSKLWKDLVNLKPLLQDQILWKIGRGEEIPVFSQPWFPNWKNFAAANSLQRKQLVSSLIQPGTNQWDFTSLEQAFGFTQALLIATDDTIKPGTGPMSDKLLFTAAKNGNFSVKKMYQLVKGDVGSIQEKALWDGIWSS